MKETINLILVNLTMCSTSSNQAVFFVSVSGDDQNPGTQEKPVKTIAQAIKLVSTHAPSLKDVELHVATGQYNEQVQLIAGIVIQGGHTQDFSESKVISEGHLEKYKSC